MRHNDQEALTRLAPSPLAPSFTKGGSQPGHPQIRECKKPSTTAEARRTLALTSEFTYQRNRL